MNDTGSGISRVLVINFHYVRDAGGPYPNLYRSTPEQFAHQLDTLEEHAVFLSPHRLLGWLSGQEELEPSDYFCLTFDDGLSDHISAVAPELESRRWSGFFFVNTQPWEGEMCDVQRFQLLRACVPFEELSGRFMEVVAAIDSTSSMRLDEIAEATALAQYQYDETPVARFKFALNFLLPRSTAVLVTRQLFSEFLGDERKHTELLYLSPSQTRDLARRGHLVGLHTHTHAPLASLDSSAMAKEITTNARLLGETLGAAPTSIAYPYGGPSAVSAAVVRSCARLGLRFGFTMNRGFIVAGSDHMRLDRVDSNDAPGGKAPSVAFAASAGL